MNLDNYSKDLLAWGAMGAIRAMARYRPDDLTDHVLGLVRDFDHLDALDEQREREEWGEKLREARA
jgi:hypothetical protein